MKYRAEIDGLRALAVLPVILFHAGFEWFGGGFVGVDVFFVISGYLITTLIVNEVATGTFSIVKFYERRARRILPALFFVMLICLPFAWLWLNPKDLEAFGKSLIAVSTFSSNILFWQESGYFDIAAELKPLLHTWSLAVEEQYYIVFPVVIIFLWRLGLKWLLSLLALTFLVSLSISQWGALNEPEATFYLLPTRGWELLIGVFAALYLRYNNYFTHKNANQTLSLLGIALIIYAIVAFDETTPFPSAYALIPTIGTALLILHAVPDTILHKILSLRPIVGVGLISYSAYLWHQPMLAFARHRSLTELSDLHLIGICVLSLLMAYFSWRWVEKPFRNKDKVTKKVIWSLSGIGISFFIILGLIFIWNDGFKSRFNVDLTSVSTVNQQKCHIATSTRDIELIRKHNFCMLGNPSQQPDTFIVGDSHAGAIADQVGEYFESIGRSLYAFSGGFCAPAIGFALEKYGRDCLQEIGAIYDFIIKSDDIKHVVIYAQWSNYTTGKRDNYKMQVGCHYSKCLDTPADNPELFARLLSDTIRMLNASDKNVVLIKSTPEFKHVVIPNLYKAAISNGSDEFNSIHAKEYGSRNSAIEKIFRETSDVTFVDSYDLFCERDICQSLQDGAPLFSDTNHVTNLGADILVEALKAHLNHRP